MPGNCASDSSSKLFRLLSWIESVLLSTDEQKKRMQDRSRSKHGYDKSDKYEKHARSRSSRIVNATNDWRPGGFVE